MLLVVLQTGLRVSELIGLNIEDIGFQTASQGYVQCRGKGRKHRANRAQVF